MARRLFWGSLALLVVLPFSLAVRGASAAPPKTGSVTVPGGKLFYEERGSGPAVILIHGGMLDHRMWDPQVEALARGHRLIRYDVAGHGRSPAPDGAWRDHEHLGLLMEALKVEHASLVGLSLGGRVTPGGRRTSSSGRGSPGRTGRPPRSTRPCGRERWRWPCRTP